MGTNMEDEIRDHVSRLYFEWVGMVECVESCNTDEELQKGFIRIIQEAIGSKFVIKSVQEMDDDMDYYHRSMEGMG